MENLGPKQDEMVLVLGDGTGHGIGAALLMASTRAYLRMQAEYRHSPQFFFQILISYLLVIAMVRALCDAVLFADFRW